MRYDLRKGSFREAWEEFIPSLSNKIKGGGEYLENCGSCERRSDCRWCPIYGHLEHGRYEAKVEYLCDVAKACQAFKDDWKRSHRRFYRIAGITIQVDSDLPFSLETFNEKFASFQVQGPGEDNVVLSHHFSLLISKTRIWKGGLQKASLGYLQEEQLLDLPGHFATGGR